MSDVLFKVIVIGDATVGKTSFVQRYVHGAHRREYKPTIGVDFALKVIRWSENATVRLQAIPDAYVNFKSIVVLFFASMNCGNSVDSNKLWDIAGQERFHTMTRVYYQRAAACVIMFDLSSQQTLKSTLGWKKDLDSKCTLPNGKTIPCILVGNKSDLPSRPVSKETIDEMCREQSFLGWTEMSVKEDINVAETMDYLVTELMANHDADEASAGASQNNTSADQGGFIKLGNKNPQKQSEKRSCCSS